MNDHIYEEIADSREPHYEQPRMRASSSPQPHYENVPYFLTSTPSEPNLTQHETLTRWSGRSNLYYRWGCCNTCDVPQLKKHVLWLFCIVALLMCLAIIVACLTIPPGYPRAITVAIIVIAIFVIMMPFCPSPIRLRCLRFFDRIADAT